jgi:hypothetical protein
LDASGNTIWSKAHYGAILNDVMYDDRDNSILINGRGSGTRQGVTGYIGMDDMLLMKIDTAGNFKWGRLYGTSANDEARGLCKGTGNNYLMVGTAFDDTNNLDRGAIMNIDGAGNLLDQKIITGDWGNGYLRVFPYKGSFGVFGQTGSLKLTEGTGQNCPVGIHGSGAMTLSKLDLWKTGIEEPAAVQDDNLALSPNPAHSSVIIRFNEKHSSGTLTGINALGNVVFRQTIEVGADKLIITTINWMSGNYVLCWQPTGGVQHSAMLTIH